MNRKTKAVAVALITCFLVFASYQCLFAKKPVDVSWISTVEQMLLDSQPYPESNTYFDPEILNIYLNENGSEQLVYSGGGNNLSSYLTALMESVNDQRDSTVAEYDLAKILQADKVVSLRYNQTFVSKNCLSMRFYSAYFVLQDNLKQDLTGAIFVRPTDYRLGHLNLYFITQ
jgi:hypothetical protein